MRDVNLRVGVCFRGCAGYNAAYFRVWRAGRALRSLHLSALPVDGEHLHFGAINS